MTTMFDDFCTKVNQELTDFENTLKVATSEYVIDHAYELVIKREIVNLLTEEPSLFDSWSIADQGRAMSVSGILDWFYTFWLKFDFSILEPLRDFIGYTIKTVALPEVPTSVFS